MRSIAPGATVGKRVVPERGAADSPPRRWRAGVTADVGREMWEKLRELIDVATIWKAFQIAHSNVGAQWHWL
jgi:hypothetical protein